MLVALAEDIFSHASPRVNNCFALKILTDSTSRSSLQPQLTEKMGYKPRHDRVAEDGFNRFMLEF